MAENGYKPFVVIRPENEASQSLYKKLGFHMLYTIVRMTFVPETWCEPNGDIVEAVRQLTIAAEQEEERGLITRVVDEALEPIPEECGNKETRPDANGKD